MSFFSSFLASSSLAVPKVSVSDPKPHFLATSFRPCMYLRNAAFRSCQPITGVRYACDVVLRPHYESTTQ